MNIGKAIKDLRKQKGLKQKDFASLCSISATYLCQIEANQRDANISTLKTISDALDVPLPVIFFLSLDQNDISPQKREAFNILAPSINSFITEFFIPQFPGNDTLNSTS